MPQRLLFLTLFIFGIQHFTQAQSLQDKIGQMIMVGFGTNDIAADTLQKDLGERNLGGVLFFGYNLRFPTQIKAQISQLKSYANTPPFFSTDQEGGIVARLNGNNGYAETYTAYELGYLFDSEDSTRAQANLMAAWLANAGFNMNLAPVVDVNVNPDSPAIAELDRSFSDDEYKVYQHSSWFIDEFKKQNITTSLKHFPGHGSAVSDSHLGFTDITDTWEERELAPFKMLIEDGYRETIMTGHLFNRNWDTDYPASLSEYAITTMLRDSLGFEGVVITDELFMDAIEDNYGLDEAIINTINAGTDILLFSTNLYNKQSLPGYVISLVTKKVANGTIAESTIDAAYDRIMNLKDQRSITSTEWIAEKSQQPSQIQLSNYPNPFNPATNIRITLMKPQEVTIQVTNTLGQVVQTLDQSKLTAGVHTYRFDAKSLASGIYFVRVNSTIQRKTHKMLLLK